MKRIEIEHPKGSFAVEVIESAGQWLFRIESAGGSIHDSRPYPDAEEAESAARDFIRQVVEPT